MEQNEFFIEELQDTTHESAEAIRGLIKQIGDHCKELTDDDFRDMITSPMNHLFVTREKATNKIVGMVTVLVYRIPYAKKAYVDDFVIDNAYRNHGLGTHLFHKAMDFAKSQKVAYVQFTSSQKREGSNEFYNKLGFQKRDTNVYRLDFSYEEE
jgi:ribosomal protein S18 acetylase RimI-like enzyme